MAAQVTIPALLRRAAAADPDGAAASVDGGDRLTYGGWRERSGALARGLRRRGLQPGERVALVFDATRWCDYAVAYVAVQAAGAVPVPLVAGAGDGELARALAHCRASAVVAPPGLALARDDVPVLDPAVLEAAGTGGPELQAAPPPPLAEILYLARPLSRPVALARSSSDLLRRRAWVDEPSATAPAVLHAFPPGTVAGQDALLAALTAPPAGCAVLPVFEPRRFCALLAGERIRAGALHPATAQALLAGATVGHDLTGVRCLLLVGQAPPALRAGLAAAFPQASLVIVEGATADPPDDEARSAPVASSQEGMLWHEHFAPGCQNLPGLARRLRGPLDSGALRRALDEIVRRHEPLRATFCVRDGSLRQTVRAHRTLELPVHDLSGLQPNEREAEVARRVADAGRRPFDLTGDPLFAPALLRLTETDHVLVIRTHHSVFDDWSVGVFRRQLAALYTAFANGRPSPLPEPPTSFSAFARSQRRSLAGPTGDRETAFWRRELDGAPFTTQLPMDDPRLPEGSAQAAGGPTALRLPLALREGLRGLARAQRATVFMALLAAYGLLVQRYTGRDDLLLATVVANRNRTELEELIGCFTKKVPLRLRLGGDPSFTEALERTRSALLGALAHQDTAFEAVVQDVLGAEAAAHGLVPHVALMFQGEAPRQEIALAGLDSSGLETSTRAQRAHFMAETPTRRPAGGEPAAPWGAGLYTGTFVIVSVAETDEGLSCVARGAFHGPAVRGLLDSYRTLLAAAVADPSARASRLRLLDGTARDEALARGRGPAEALRAATLHDAFRTQARRLPDAAAVRTRGGVLTYAELDARSDRLGAGLQALGVRPGDTVGVALDPSPDLVVAALAVWKAGAAWAALAPEEGSDRLERTLADSAITVVVGEDPRGVLAGRARLVLADHGAGARRPQPVTVPADAPAVVFHGTGPSALPGGVTLGHAGLLSLAAGLRRAVGRPGGAARRSVCLPAATQDGFVRQLVGLLGGDTLWAPGPAGGGVLALVRSGEVDAVDCTPGELDGLLGAGLRDALAARAEPLVVLVGLRRGASPEAWHRMRSLAGARVLALYGPPECAFGATLAAVASHARPVAGVPLANVEAHVLDRHGEPVPPRAQGELHLGGPSLAEGCGGHREGGGAVGGAEGLWATGQRARCLPDGTVELLGDAGAVADLRGFPVDRARLRSALRGCPGVRDAQVTLDAGGQRLVAQVAPHGTPPSVAALRAHLWSRLPGYACPAAVETADDQADAGEGPGRGDQDADAAVARPDGSAEASVLARLWADTGGERSRGNYWQQFAFLEALARAREAGLPVGAEQVTRNRTVATLATDLASRAQRRRGA